MRRGLLLALFALAGALVTDPAFGDTDVRHVSTIAYGEAPHQDMDVYWSSDGHARPGIFLVHGGWWSEGDKKAHTALAKAYAAQGYFVVSVNYRLSGEATWPAQRDDLAAAISWARSHARSLDFDASRFVVIGFSAGGHLAADYGTYGDGRPGLRGIVALSPVASPLTAVSDAVDDLSSKVVRLSDSAVALAGCEPLMCPSTWEDMEPAAHASEGDAPLLSFHSRNEFVPSSHSEGLVSALRAVGVSAELRVVPGNAHAAPLMANPKVRTYMNHWIHEELFSPIA